MTQMDPNGINARFAHLQFAQRIDNGAIAFPGESCQREDGDANRNVLEEFGYAAHVTLEGPTLLGIDYCGHRDTDQNDQQIGQRQ